ncbi:MULTISPECIES: tripartite tricarboxylate transporter substrate binding protein [Bacillaceae]|uniref:tripartite tricarboxylate transporter substrate binding protein n=1 Tax=Bacillaceae TaxID=186817 RepID=UPI000BFC8A7E|nr:MULTISPECIES: tripartite tricarboxylate transporter substrate-binding protein [Bacillaceae]PGT81770.1 hypothetical protein COD11_16760 [Bacillus sp. AFS040349]UGB33323.1 tripartite tricarboxylate transporter substrate binding protein [Metabacillus sp. B2-18]
MRKRIFYVCLYFLLFLFGCSVQENNEFLLSEDITIIAPSSKGGGWDLTARAVQRTLLSEGIIEEDIQVVNKIGAGGELGWKFLSQQEGQVLAMNSSLLITNHLLGQSKLTFKDFTPIATLATEWEAVIVSKESEMNSAKMLMEKMESAPESFKIGVSPRLGNDDQLSFVLASKQADIEPTKLNFRVYENSQQVVDALLAKQIDVATMTISEAIKYYELNQVKLLVVSADSRLRELPMIPTWKEEGIDVVFSHWRGIMGPPNMTKEEISFWDKTLSEMVKTKKWQEILDEYMWKSFYKDSKDTFNYLEQQSEMYERLMGVNEMS